MVYLHRKNSNMSVLTWVWQNKFRCICTGIAATGWMALTVPTERMWIQKLYYRFAPNEMCAPSQKTVTLFNEVLLDLNTVKPGKPLDVRKILVRQGTQAFPEYQQRGCLEHGGSFIVLVRGHHNEQLSNLLPKDYMAKITLSEDIQRYAIARQLIYSEDNYGLIKYYLGSVLIVLYSIVDYFTVQHVLKSKLIERTEHLAVLERGIARFLILSRMPILVAMFMNVYWTCMYGYSRRVEKSTDELIATMGEKYVIGGMDFYKEAIARNKKKNKTSLHYKITKEGNYRSGYIHQKTRKFTERMKYFEDQMEKRNIILPVVEKPLEQPVKQAAV